ANEILRINKEINIERFTKLLFDRTLRENRAIDREFFMKLSQGINLHLLNKLGVDPKNPRIIKALKLGDKVGEIGNAIMTQTVLSEKQVFGVFHTVLEILDTLPFEALKKVEGNSITNRKELTNFRTKILKILKEFHDNKPVKLDRNTFKQLTVIGQANIIYAIGSKGTLYFDNYIKAGRIIVDKLEPKHG
ncbi:MAG: hypothetical protein Q7S21_02370, partial [archaeon]|nr:hypothetical protein [archaeon]